MIISYMYFSTRSTYNLLLSGLLPITISRDRPTKYCIFLKIFSNFPVQFVLRYWAFFYTELGVFVDYSGYNTEYTEFV